MTRRLLISPHAWRDLGAIEDYTIHEWGQVQAEIYVRAIDEAFQTLKENPAIGHRTDDLPKSYRVHPVAKHIAIYRYDARMVEILTILHPAMDVKKRLKDALKAKKPRVTKR